MEKHRVFIIPGTYGHIAMVDGHMDSATSDFDVNKAVVLALEKAGVIETVNLADHVRKLEAAAEEAAKEPEGE